MNYKETLEYIQSLKCYGSARDLDNIRRLCDRLGYSEENCKLIHIAGTNGDGSVSAYVAHIMLAAGYKVGRYEPSVINDYRERFQTGTRMITQKDLCAYMERLKAVCEGLVAEGYPHPTAFEAETALSYLYFAEKGCEYVVFEDHIAKPGTLYIDCKLAGDAQVKGLKYGLTTQQFSYKDLPKVKIHIAGTHQIRNAVLALEVVLQLRHAGLKISDKAIYQGLENTAIPGRLEILGKKPMFIIDGTHNEEEAAQLAASIETYFPGKRLIYIMGVLKHTDYERMLILTAKYAEHILTITPPDNPKGLSAFELAVAAGRYHPRVTNLSSLEEAVEVSHLLADKDTVILCFGELSYLGAMKKVFANTYRN